MGQDPDEGLGGARPVAVSAWALRAGDNGPRCLQVSGGAVGLHLTEHYGDCSPGAEVFVNADDVGAPHREHCERPNPNMRPGVEVAPWNAKVMDIIGPFGNRLSFNQPLEKS